MRNSSEESWSVLLGLMEKISNGRVVNVKHELHRQKLFIPS